MKLSLYLPVALIAGVAFTSCQDDTENFDNKVYTTTQNPLTTIYVKSTTTEAVGYVQAAMAKNEGSDVSVSFGANPGKVGDFNSIYSMKAEMLPGEYYTIPSPTAVIPAGGTTTDRVAVNFVNLDRLDVSKLYVLPVSIVSAPFGTLSNNTYYFLVREASLISMVANMTDNFAQYLTGNQATSLENMTQITVEGLLNPDNFPNMLSTIMGIEGDVLVRIGDAGIPANQLQFAAPNGNVTDPSWQFETGKWTFLTLTYDSETGEVNVYFNGVKKGDTKVSGYKGPVNWNTASGDIKDGPRGFYVGYSYDSNRPFQGCMSELRVWNRILTADEINAPYHFYSVESDSPGLVAYWKMDDGAGKVLKDYANGYDLTCDKAPEWVPISLPEK